MKYEKYVFRSRQFSSLANAMLCSYIEYVWAVLSDNEHKNLKPSESRSRMDNDEMTNSPTLIDTQFWLIMAPDPAKVTMLHDQNNMIK